MLSDAYYSGCFNRADVCAISHEGQLSAGKASTHVMCSRFSQDEEFVLVVYGNRTQGDRATRPSAWNDGVTDEQRIRNPSRLFRETVSSVDADDHLRKVRYL